MISPVYSSSCECKSFDRHLTYRLFSRIVLEGNFEILRYYLPFYFWSICSFSHWYIFQPREGVKMAALFDRLSDHFCMFCFYQAVLHCFRIEWSQIWPACAKNRNFWSNFWNHFKIRRAIPKYDLKVFWKREKYDLEPDKVGSPDLR